MGSDIHSVVSSSGGERRKGPHLVRRGGLPVSRAAEVGRALSAEKGVPSTLGRHETVPKALLAPPQSRCVLSSQAHLIVMLMRTQPTNLKKAVLEYSLSSSGERNEAKIWRRFGRASLGRFEVCVVVGRSIQRRGSRTLPPE